MDACFRMLALGSHSCFRFLQKLSEKWTLVLEQEVDTCFRTLAVILVSDFWGMEASFITLAVRFLQTL